MTPGWSAPGCAGGTWLDTEPTASIVIAIYDDPQWYALSMALARVDQLQRQSMDELLLAHALTLGTAAAEDMTAELHANGMLPPDYRLALGPPPARPVP